MKLRLRSLETKQTHKIETPDPCSLHHLKQLLLNLLNNHNPSSIQNLRLSLNRKDLIPNDEPQRSLQSLDITSGDLIFFTFNPSAFNPQTTLESTIGGKPSSNETSNPLNTLELPVNLKNEDTHEEKLIGNSDMTLESSIGGKPTSDETSNQLNTLELPVNLQNEDTQKEKLIGKEEEVVVGGEEDYMEVDDDGVVYEGSVGKSFSVPGFLRKVFSEKLGDRGGHDHELLVIAIHAVLLESGFVRFDPVAKIAINEFQFQNECASGFFKLSLYYTFPEMITCATDPIDAVVLKFHSLSKSLTVYGCLWNYKSVVHRVKFDEDKLVPFLNVVWANCGLGEGEGASETSAEKQVFEFWRNVKDGLALPLLIDLCEKVGFVLPPCFTRLPTEIKLKILEFLPGVDVAKISCVSSELRYLSSSDGLWKKKYVEQFGNASSTREGEYWKQKFVNSWESRKRRRLVSRIPHVRELYPRRRMPPPILGGARDIWPHGVIGGDYDRLPQPLGGILPGLGGAVHPLRRQQLPSHVPRCNPSRSNNRNFI